MHSNWDQIAERWPRYGIGKSDIKLVDVSECVFIGKGPHEFAVYSFGRYVRRSKHESNGKYPLCIRFGIHFPDFVSDEEPAIGQLRTRYGNNTLGLVEPVQLLAVIASENGPVFWERLWTELNEKPRLDDKIFANEGWISAEIGEVLEATEVVRGEKLPEFEPKPSTQSCSISISIDDIPVSQFDEFEPDEDQLSALRVGRWAYNLKKDLKQGGDGRQAKRERVVLREDLRRVDESLFKGQLGWTDPSIGFSIKKGATNLQVSVTFDSGVQMNVDIYWIDFLSEEHAEIVSGQMKDHYRGTPYDDSIVASRWEKECPFYTPSEARTVGRGLEEVYAYTYASCVDEASLAEEPFYPMKIGHTADIGGALSRVAGQFPRALAGDAQLQFIGRCEDGRLTEGKIHRRLKDAGRKLESAPGKEWFSTTASEVEELFRQYAT